MKTKTAFLFILLAFALTFANISPSRAQGEEPPANAADIATLTRVVDLYYGIEGAYPEFMTVYGTTLFFTAYANNGIGRELWIYDSANPVGLSNPLAYDISLGTTSSDTQYLTVYAGALYFGANGDNGYGQELWKFTWANGAQFVADIAPGGSFSFPSYLTVYGTALFFAANGNNGIGKELWIYDSALPVGVTNPTAYDVCPGSGSSNPAHLAIYNGELYFAADGCDGAGDELWKFDWINGAQRVADIYNGSGDSHPKFLEVYNDALYFGADGNDGARSELWSYNPVDGAQRVADIAIGSEIGSNPEYLAVYNGALYFAADGNDGAGYELWKYDPVNGADRVADIYPGIGGSNPTCMTVYNGALYFSANGNDGAGNELWKYDNTAIATFRPSKSYEGWVLESGENTNVGGTLNNSATTFRLGDDALNKQYRSILSFNTSTLPDNAVITSATLKIRQQGLVGTNPFTTHGNIVVDIIKGAFSGNNALQASDFQSVPGRANAGVIRNLPDGNNWFTSVLTKAAYPFINPTGVTQFRLRFSKDDNNDKGADFLRFFSADSASMSDFPLLEVKYYIP